MHYGSIFSLLTRAGSAENVVDCVASPGASAAGHVGVAMTIGGAELAKAAAFAKSVEGSASPGVGSR